MRKRWNRLCGLQEYTSVQFLDFLELTKNCTFLGRKLISALYRAADGQELESILGLLTQIVGSISTIFFRNEPHMKNALSNDMKLI
jgi:hypothetical protein